MGDAASSTIAANTLHCCTAHACARKSLDNFLRKAGIVNVLVTGASGLIGSRCAYALRLAGHRVTAGVHRTAVRESHITLDFAKDFDTETWIPRLRGIDIVVNAVGIIAERGNQSFDALHRRAPQALFAACAAAGVRRVIQISALGADEQAATEFHRTKKAADDFLLALPIEATVLQPSLVFAEHGSSTRLFAQLAAAPLLAVPAGGHRIQPVAIDELIEAVVRLAEIEAPPRRLAAVGGAALGLADYLQLLRMRMGFARGWIVSIPLPWLRLFSRIAGDLVSADTLSMLERGNCADPAAFARLLGRMPATPSEFVEPAAAATLRRDAALQTASHALRITIAAMWIFTGIVSLGLYPIADSLALLERTGLVGLPARIALFGAAGLDIAIGICTLLLRRPWIWTVQILLIAVYTIIISIALPEFWLHPYGPVLKNIPLLAAIAFMRNLEQRRWNT